jgi:hypothetical protein
VVYQFVFGVVLCSGIYWVTESGVLLSSFGVFVAVCIELQRLEC